MDDPRLLVDGSGHMPFHYATGQCGLYNLLHPRPNLTSFALMATTAADDSRSSSSLSTRYSQESGGALKRRTSSLSTGDRAPEGGPLKEELWAQLWAQLRKAHCAPYNASPWGVCGSGISLPAGSNARAERPPPECTISEVNAVTPLRMSGQPTRELDGIHRPETSTQERDSPSGSQRHWPRFSYPGSILSGLRLPRTSTSSMMASSHDDTSHTWRCELLPCQHSMCGVCAEQLFECQEPAASICCPMCHTPVKELKPAT